MHFSTYQCLFPWEEALREHSLEVISDLLTFIPDTQLLYSLRSARGRGRNDYPVSALWGVALLTPLLRHPTHEACLAELRRNSSLRRIIGLDTEASVPHKWNFSRFLEVLGQVSHFALLRSCFDTMVRRLAAEVPDLGNFVVGDSTSLNVRPDSDSSTTNPKTSAQTSSKNHAAAKTNQKSQSRVSKTIADPNQLPQPSGGRKEYHDDQGKVTRVVQWFGYKLHLLVDYKYEIALAYQITAPNVGDNEPIAALLQQAQANLPPGRIRTLSYDKAADDSKVHDLLNKHNIRPLIHNRALWKDELEKILPGHNGLSNLVYDEAGTIWCYDKTQNPPVRHKMAYVGLEAKRGTLKYRCPARHEGWNCPSDSICNHNKSYGLVARIKREWDLRRFPAIPRATKQFETLYRNRTAVERVNARLKLIWGLDDGNVKGAERFHGHAASVMLVHLAMATVLASSLRYEPGTTLARLNLSPIARNLRKYLDEKKANTSD